ncbi:hypothetical protein [Alkalihalobacillus pseudalcaliphilus]|uniref:hypothetical protein n=1 Tax=Alkalihalobacillus pseudalcaliphilus TaxID=79884 RepID=UPI00064E0072|nr:hypothetical protein [Alkalihalobacillus pseudalcaliphilus]KMK76427.1 hypothetical protein AB990_14665 [Alkalihalobacillus pseudalcaliphilus]
MYLIDRVNEMREGHFIQRVYLVNEGKVTFVQNQFAHWNKRRMDMSGFTLEVGRVMSEHHTLDENTHNDQSHLIKKGCTTAVLFPQVAYESKIQDVYDTTKKKMYSSRVDYVIGLEIPLRLLRPSVLLACKKYKIPALKIEIKQGDKPADMAWMYIAQVQREYRTVLLPYFSSGNESEIQEQRTAWKQAMSDYKISWHSFIKEGKPWPKELLQKVGLYPIKGTLMVGSDLDYLLFSENQSQLVDANDNLDYDYRHPCIVVLRGQIIKINEQDGGKLGYGRLIDIKMPGRLLAMGIVY